ncbi:BCCT family transporter [Cellulomonas sp. DKR-3]|uniref:BCCT family transporter n=1 Tax=Cellulomonas fulva TaxID=2835530 RepID=A0ABS5TY76_9CELL|nr:BCCT family transporter [Cellulomonas fulva]MBT0994099.1 BCCT family transporter [Cellulomonas fulva]
MSTSATPLPGADAGRPPDEPAPIPPPADPSSGARPAIAKAVFLPGLAIVLVVGLFAVLFPDLAESAIGTIQTDVIGVFGWYYVLVVAAFVVFALWMGVSRFGDIMLGQDDDTPAYSMGSWFSMLFAAGMGIGLVFWGVAEPLSHYAQPKPGVTGAPDQLADAAMAQTYLHWGVHAWAVYVVVGLGLAYAIHRRGRPVAVRWAVEPLLGERRTRGRLGDAIDVAAVVGTVFGLATSLGLGVLQISAGLEHLDLIDSSTTVQVVLILVITLAATASVVSGLDKGLKWLSNLNIGIAGTLLVLVLVLGPTLFLLREFVQSIGVYLGDVVPLTFDTTAFEGDAGQAWQASWTTFYWGWWISWAPFVGVFIARISRGRTVRQFVMGVLIIPVLVTFLWFSVLGGTALYREIFGEGGLIGAGGTVDENTALFDLLGGLPGGVVMSVGAVLLIALFFVTSSDSGSFVVSMLTSGGNPTPFTWTRVTWSVMTGLLAAALLVAGGLTALQTAAILIALPFSVVMILIAIATIKAFLAEHAAYQRAERAAVRERLTRDVAHAVHGELREHLEGLVADPAGLPGTNGRWWTRRRVRTSAGGADADPDAVTLADRPDPRA